MLNARIALERTRLPVETHSQETLFPLAHFAVARHRQCVCALRAASAKGDADASVIDTLAGRLYYCGGLGIEVVELSSRSVFTPYGRQSRCQLVGPHDRPRDRNSVND